jgi:hypothetical protein
LFQQLSVFQGGPEGGSQVTHVLLNTWTLTLGANYEPKRTYFLILCSIGKVWDANYVCEDFRVILSLFHVWNTFPILFPLTNAFSTNLCNSPNFVGI